MKWILILAGAVVFGLGLYRGNTYGVVGGLIMVGVWWGAWYHASHSGGSAGNGSLGGGSANDPHD